MKKIYKKISLRSKIFNYIISLLWYKEISSSREKTLRKIIKKKRFIMPKIYNTNLINIFNTDMYIFNGNMESLKDDVIIYMHGGGYTNEAMIYELNLIYKIATKSNSAVIMPRYKLAPEYSYNDTYPIILKLYKKLLTTNKKITLLGDSAGGGFILSFCEYLRTLNIKQPSNIIMLSPWLDISMTNKNIDYYNKKDPNLSIEGLKLRGDFWRKELDNKNYLVSPIYGDLKGLGKLSIFIGTREILYPDCELLCKKLDALKIDYNYFEYTGQSHVFMCYPIKESKVAIDTIINIIRS